MRNIPYGFRYLNTWSLVGDAVWGVSTTLMEEMHH